MERGGCPLHFNQSDQTEVLKDTLNELGEQGWELLQISLLAEMAQWPFGNAKSKTRGNSQREA